MGWLKDTVEDFNYFGALLKNRRKKGLLVMLALLIIAILVADAKKFGEAPAEWLLTHGLSLMNRVTITAIIEERDRLAANDDDFGLEVLASGTVIPVPCNQQVEIKLVDGLTSSVVSKQLVKTDKQGHWVAATPIVISELGSYSLDVTASVGVRVIGEYKQAITRVTPDTFVDTSSVLKAYLTDKPFPSQRPKKIINPTKVFICYFASPNFNVNLFEELLLRLNLLLSSQEIILVDSKELQDKFKSKSLKSIDDYVGLLKEVSRNYNGLTIGITSSEIADNNFLKVEDKYAVISTNDTSIFGTQSNPSVYKYLLTTIVSLGSVYKSEKLEFHDETYGCLFDYCEEKVRARITVNSGYLCSDDAKKYKTALMPAQYTDLTDVLPLVWLK